MDDVWEWHTYEPGSPVPPPLEPNEPEKLAASRFALVSSQEIEEAKNAEVKRERVLLPKISIKELSAQQTIN